MVKTALRRVQVQSIRYEAENILSYELVDPGGAQLPEFQPGAHVDVHLNAGLIRQFSLCSPPWMLASYRIAVLLETHSKGGSEFMHCHVKIGDFLKISMPKCHFKLASNAVRHVFVAGGIGITPILCMVHCLERQQSNYVLHYCTRTVEKTAFREEIENLVKYGEVQFHFDGGDPSKGLNIHKTLAVQEPGSHLYYCGPGGLMQAIGDASTHWQPGTVHFEYFTSESLPVKDKEAFAANWEFQVRLAKSNALYTVPKDKSIVEVLRENDIWVDTSCEEGICGTCLTRYLEGEPEHRDMILDEDDREDYVLICCARSKTPELVLDL